MKDRFYMDLEDEKIASLLHEYAEEDGRRLIEENERLQRDPAFIVPETFGHACRDAIECAAKRERRIVSWKKVQKILERAAIVALVLCLSGGTLFCTVDAFKVYILNTFSSHKDTNTRVDITDKDELVDTVDIFESIWLPEGYEHIFSDNTSEDFQVHYFQSSNQDVIELYCVRSFSGTINVDTENAAIADEVDINGNVGWLETKEKKHLSWYIYEKETLCDLFCDLSISDEDVLKIARSLK